MVAGVPAEAALIDLALQFGRPARDRKRGAVTFHLYPTRGDLADWLGLTIETVSRQISALKRDGVITLEGNRRVTVPDFHRLVLESGDDSDGGLPA